MHFAVRGEASFSAQRPQTTYFAHRDSATITGEPGGRPVAPHRRQEAAGSVEDPQDSRMSSATFRSTLIRDFVGTYRFHEDSETHVLICS